VPFQVLKALAVTAGLVLVKTANLLQVDKLSTEASTNRAEHGSGWVTSASLRNARRILAWANAHDPQEYFGSLSGQMFEQKEPATMSASGATSNLA
jgi:hypothetical protein